MGEERQKAIIDALDRIGYWARQGVIAKNSGDDAVRAMLDAVDMDYRLIREEIEDTGTASSEGEPLVCIWSGEWNKWWRPNSAGYTPDWREAGVYTLSKAQDILAGVGDEKELEIVTYTPIRRGDD